MVKWILIIAALIALPLVVLWLLALYGVNQWTRPKRARHATHPRDYSLPCEEVCFTARDGVQLRGWFIPPSPRTLCRAHSRAHRASRGGTGHSPLPSWERGAGVRAVIFCHGHGGTPAPDLIYAPWFHERGIPVLMFDFRNHGLSDGTLTSMGFYERRDLLGAIDYMRARGYPRIGLFGFSMGASIAIATTPLSENVVCVVADSPFAALRPTLARAIQLRGFPRWFADRFINIIFWLAQRRLRCDFDEAAPVHAVQQFGRRPLLIILGEHDEFIAPWQGRLLYEKASGPKEFWLVPAVSHRAVDRYRPEEYREKVMSFFEQWLMSDT